MVFELGVEFRDDGLVVPGYGDDPEFLALLGRYGTELRHVHPYERGLFLELEYRNLQLAPCEVKRICCGSPLEQVNDFSGRDFFRIEHQVYAHFREQVFVLICEIFLIVYPCRDFFAAEFLRQYGAHDIHILGV